MELLFGNMISPEDYNTMRAAVNWKPLSERQVANVLRNTDHFITALDGGQIVGLSRILTDHANIYFIADVIVLPECHGQGVGRLLMERALDYIKNDAQPGETVQIHLMSVKGREGFYDKFGFRRRPDDEFGHGMTQWYTK